MDPLVALAEEKIREAMARGEFDNLPGAGKPLVLDDDSMVPEDLRVASWVLKNAGCIPPELELRKEIITLKGLLRAARDSEEKTRVFRELNAKLLRFNLTRKRPLDLDDFPEYRERVLDRLAR
ncbi:MAG: DUF1992 domain-containing protein [Deltaproteobacteria bacterium]|nr:DUF1992 domain-containing protein [Deltaproteobacteria bacterium]